MAYWEMPKAITKKFPRENVEAPSTTLQWFGGKIELQTCTSPATLPRPACQVKGNPVRRPPMPYHRFTAGDIVAITPGKAPPTQAEMDSGSVLDGVVLQRCVRAVVFSPRWFSKFY